VPHINMKMLHATPASQAMLISIVHAVRPNSKTLQDELRRRMACRKTNVATVPRMPISEKMTATIRSSVDVDRNTSGNAKLLEVVSQVHHT